MEYNNLFRLFLPFTTKKGCILGLQPKKGCYEQRKMEANRKFNLPFASIYLLHKEQVKLHLPTELDGLHRSAMPSAEGDVVIVDVPVATLDLSQ